MCLRPPTAAVVAWLILGLAARTAMAQAVSQPVQPRIIHVPTAWLQPDGAVFASIGLGHTLEPMFGLSVGLGGVAEVDVQLTDTSEAAVSNEGGPGTRIAGLAVATAAFKTGVPAGLLGAWQPAVAIAFRRSFSFAPALQIRPTIGRDVQIAQLSLMMSLPLGSQVDVHLGGDAWAASDASLDQSPGLPGTSLRPSAAIEWRPSIFPRSTAMLDFAWVPHFANDRPTLEWLGAFGIRYQPLSWGALELGVQMHQSSVSSPTVFVRLSAWNLRSARRGAQKPAQ